LHNHKHKLLLQIYLTSQIPLPLIVIYFRIPVVVVQQILSNHQIKILSIIVQLMFSIHNNKNQQWIYLVSRFSNLHNNHSNNLFKTYFLNPNKEVWICFNNNNLPQTWTFSINNRIQGLIYLINHHYFSNQWCNLNQC
jgi:hypothetical protein